MTHNVRKVLIETNLLFSTWQLSLGLWPTLEAFFSSNITFIWADIDGNF
jgi:rRNA-processing protein FCF1